MRCPRCTLAELPDGTETCVLCGYSSASVAVAEAPPPPPPPAQRLSPTELDARRELARDFRIDSLLEAPTGQIVYLAKSFRGSEWKTLSIPLGKSEQYNRDPTLEKLS